MAQLVTRSGNAFLQQRTKEFLPRSVLLMIPASGNSGHLSIDDLNGQGWKLDISTYT